MGKFWCLLLIASCEGMLGEKSIRARDTLRSGRRVVKESWFFFEASKCLLCVRSKPDTMQSRS